MINRKKQKSLFIFLCLVFLIPGELFAADIKGKVIIRQQAVLKSGGGLSALYKRSTGTQATSSGSVKAVVFLKEVPGIPLPEPVTGAKIAQSNMTFVPHVLAIPVGTSVDFPNMDIVYHNVFSLSKTKEFDLGRYAKGKSKSIDFDKPGVVEVFCEIHSHMICYIIVSPNKYYAETDPDGEFILKDVPPGTYTITAWMENMPVKEVQVTVPKSGDAEIQIEF